MLAFYQRWAYRLRPFRRIFLLCALAALMAFGGLLFVASAEQSERWQLSSVVLAISFAVLWLWSRLFARNIARPDAAAALWQRLKQRLLLCGYYLLALGFSMILLTTLYLGLRTVKGIIAALFF